jgi:hypothetical protein
VDETEYELLERFTHHALATGADVSTATTALRAIRAKSPIVGQRVGHIFTNSSIEWAETADAGLRSIFREGELAQFCAMIDRPNKGAVSP